MGAKYISDDDIELFRKSVGPITRLTDDRIAPARPRLKRSARGAPESGRSMLQDMLSDESYERDVEINEWLAFSRPGTPSRVLQKLRRGQIQLDAELDLHGKTVAESQLALAGFLQQCRDEGIRCVRIIHGKGFGSPRGKPIIKSKLDRWLRLRNDVSAFSSARPVDGGTGALYVLLKS